MISMDSFQHLASTIAVTIEQFDHTEHISDCLLHLRGQTSRPFFETHHCLCEEFLCRVLCPDAHIVVLEKHATDAKDQGDQCVLVSDFRLS